MIALCLVSFGEEFKLVSSHFPEYSRYFHKYTSRRALEIELSGTCSSSPSRQESHHMHRQELSSDGAWRKQKQ